MFFEKQLTLKAIERESLSLWVHLKEMKGYSQCK